jgi:uncharacterized protein (TIGR03067 family)
VVFAAGLLLAADPPKVGSNDKEEKGIQGRWVAEKVVVSGADAGENETTTLVINGDFVSWTYVKRMGNTAKSSTDNYTYKLDPSKKPAEIDLCPTEGTLKDKVFPSIYEVDGDTLKVCRTQPGQKRPKEFASKEGSDDVLLVLKRAKSK